MSAESGSSANIESLNIEIKTNASSANDGLSSLINTLKRLKGAVNIGTGLESTSIQLKHLSDSATGIKNLAALSNAAKTLNGVKISPNIPKQLNLFTNAIKDVDIDSGNDKIRSIREWFDILSSVPKSNLSSYSNSIRKLFDSLAALDDARIDGARNKIRSIREWFDILSSVPKSNLSSYSNSIRKLFDSLAALDDAKIDGAKKKIEAIAAALKPLGDEMQKISNGMSAFPAKLQRLITGTNKLTGSNKKATKSYVDLWAKRGIVYAAVKRAASVIGSAITEMNDYVENVNLFTVSMGKYASEAKAFAEAAGEAMGIDPGLWMRNQGVFMTLATGFGIVSDRAYVMSQQLTQLGFDLSSFFNISFEDAMQKLQSGISGEIEPLRRLGYDLSQAKLQSIALSLGIDKAVTSMTQAEKAQLRYYAIMTQVTTAHGDMARTLNAPANQLRVFKAAITQTARAIGSVFIPILNIALPYAIAFLKILREGAEYVANLLGFSLPEVDYSGISDGIGGVEGAFDDASEAVDGFKNSLLGIDEIHTLGSGGSVLGDIQDTLDQFDFSLPTYDFIGNRIGSRVDEITKKLKTALNEYKALILAVGSALAALGIAKITTAFGTFTTKVLDSAAGFGVLNEKLAPFSAQLKKIGGLTSLIAGLALAASGGYELATSMDHLGTAITKIVGGVGFGALGGYMLGGPLGALLGGLASLATAIISAVKANNDLRKSMIDEAFYRSKGVAIKELTNAFTESTNAVKALAEGSAQSRKTIEAAMTKISDARELLEPYKNKLLETGTITDEEAAKMLGYVQDMVEGMRTELTTSMESIWDSFIGLAKAANKSFGTEIKNMQATYLELYGLINGAADEQRIVIDTLINKATKKDDDGNFIGLSKAERSQLSEAINSLTDLTATITPEQWTYDNLIQEAKNGIAFQSKEETDAQLSRFSEAYTAARNSLDTVLNDALLNSDNFLKRLDALKRQNKINTAEYEYFKNELEKSKTLLRDAYSGAVEKLNTNAREYISAVQAGAILKLEDILDELGDKWEKGELGFFDRLKTKDVVLFEGAKDAWDNISGVIDALEEVAKQIGVNAELLTEDNYYKFAYGLFDTKKMWEDFILGVPSGSYLTVDSYKVAIADFADSFREKMTAATDKIVSDAVNKNLVGSGTMSARYKQLAMYADGGFPDAGELFIARERGAELVGSIGGRTAVANNEQIIEGIKRGVKEANAESAQGGNWVIQLVDTDGNIKSETVISAAQRRNRRDGKTVIPIGT